MVIRKKDESENGGNKKTKHTKFSEKNEDFLPHDTHTYVPVTTVLRFALLPYYRRISFKTIGHKRWTVFSSLYLKNLISSPFSGVFSLTNKNSCK